ncbi:DUF1033 family protein [Sporosarcina limicola]|uniref:DUF1033 family protein n=1 Tax=Sporosarcina limicola TaxID=34101 RepID=UPI0030B8140D
MIYMKADFEPWWMFEGWEEKIQSHHTFDDAKEASVFFENLLSEFREKYDYEAIKKDHYYAFWSECEKFFCEGCDDDLQLYHGIIFKKKDQIQVVNSVNNLNI